MLVHSICCSNSTFKLSVQTTSTHRAIWVWWKVVHDMICHVEDEDCMSVVEKFEARSALAEGGGPERSENRQAGRLLVYRTHIPLATYACGEALPVRHDTHVCVRADCGLCLA
jgi:hypothetical protein